MFRLYKDSKTLPLVDKNIRITILVGISNFLSHTKVMWEKQIKEFIKEYSDNKCYLLFMPSMEDKYEENINSIHNMRELLDGLEDQYVQLIEDTFVDIDDYRFIVTPLYTNFNSYGCAAKHKMLIKKLHPDFQKALYFQKNMELDKITPDNIIVDFKYSFDFLTNNICKDKKNLILTIWSPLEVQEENETLSAYSSNSMKEFIKERPEIELWVSMNHPKYSDYTLGNTLIYNLPRDKEYRYDYDTQTKVLFYINEIKRTNKEVKN